MSNNDHTNKVADLCNSISGSCIDRCTVSRCCLQYKGDDRGHMVVLFLTPAALSKPIQRCELHATGHEWWLLVFLTSYTETACAFVSTAGSAQVFNLACSDHFVKCNIHVGWSKTFSIPFAYHQTPHCTVHSLGLSAPQCAVGSKGPSW
jgi:hypothetical protein